MRGNVSLLLIGLCVGVIAGLVLAPHGRQDVRRFVAHVARDGGSFIGAFSRPLEEMAEDLAV